MSTTEQTTGQERQTVGVIGFLRNSFQTGIGVAEKMHQAAVEIPLNMVPESVASAEQTTALKDKHRNLLRSMYGSIDAIANKAMDVGAEQAARFADSIRASAEDEQPEQHDSDAEREIVAKS